MIRPPAFSAAQGVSVTILLLLLAPVIMGLTGVIAPAFGLFPALGGHELTLTYWKDAFASTGFWEASFLSFRVGMIATLSSVTLAFLIMASLNETALLKMVLRILSPLLSIPHAAAALGLAFLLSPSGWGSRFVAQSFTGWDTPPDWLFPHDQFGFALILGLVLKEVPFLLLMMLSALNQIRAQEAMRVVKTLGYGRITGWMKAIAPQLYAQMRLPIFAVLAFSLSTIDVALILGPTRPAPLSVFVLEWMNNPVLEKRFLGAVGALVQLGAVCLSILIWVLGEKFAAPLFSASYKSGYRAYSRDRMVFGVMLIGVGLTIIPTLLGLVGLGLWSIAGLWPYPEILPNQLSLRIWQNESAELLQSFGLSCLIAATATLISLLLVIAALQSEFLRQKRAPKWAFWVLFLPLLVPQISFVPGLQLCAFSLGIAPGVFPVILGHILFVFPYMYLSLVEPWWAWDQRYAVVARSFGASEMRVLASLRFPIMLRSILIASAVGFAVSIGQYLPTLLLGAGRVETLTTEAVALASGGNRRLIGTYALLQIIAPALGFALATLLPNWVYRNRKELQIAYG